ncbi:MAG: hypothetical protein Q9191_006944 [Dirinaria sp. TL-2023a]
MDVVSGIASVTQLAAYSQVVAQRLLKLHKAAQDGPSLYQTQRSNISCLLGIIRRIGTHEALNSDDIFPLLIATASDVNSLLNLLRPKDIWYDHWFWVVSKSNEIDSTFRALNDKTRLLQVHITERTYSLVTHVQEDTKHIGRCLNSRPARMTQPSSRPNQKAQLIPSSDKLPISNAMANSNAYPEPQSSGQNHVKITASGCKAATQAEQLVANGWGSHATSAEVNASKAEAEKSARQSVANANDAYLSSGDQQEKVEAETKMEGRPQ